MDFKLWINAAQDHSIEVFIPLATLRTLCVQRPELTAYLDYYEETGLRAGHVSEGQMEAFVRGLRHRNELPADAVIG